MEKDLTRHLDEFLGDERRFERFPVKVPARVELLQGKGKNRPFFTQTLDLSATGALFPELVEMHLGDLVRIEIYLVFEEPDGTDDIQDIVTMTVMGKIIRSGESGTAVRFEEDYQMSTRRIMPLEEGREGNDVIHGL